MLKQPVFVNYLLFLPSYFFIKIINQKSLVDFSTTLFFMLDMNNNWGDYKNEKKLRGVDTWKIQTTLNGQLQNTRMIPQEKKANRHKRNV